jgi:uncharacterized protein (TIGR03663 family)
LASPPLKIRWAIFIVLALLALAVRLPQLGERPMHTDESVNAYIIGQLLAGQAFHYDPQDRHGPALAAFTLPLLKLEGAKDFSGLTESQLRLSPVLAGTATVLLFGTGVEMFGFVACFIAALLFAFAPLPVYYHRYFIHESLFVSATLGLILAGGRAWQNASAQNQSVIPAAVAGFCAALMLACKETAPLHFFALALAAFGCWLVQPSKTSTRFPWFKMISTASLVFLVTTVLLFTWFGRNPGVFADLFHAIPGFVTRAGGEGHEKPFWYYGKLLGDGWSGAVVLGLVGFGIICVFFTRRGKHPPGMDVASTAGGPKRSASRFFLAIYGLAIFAIYSVIPYKTPWLALNFWLPMAWLVGIAVEWIWFATPKFPIRAVIVCGLLTLGFLIAHDTRQRVFAAPADENNPYAYAHTVEDLLGLPARIEELSKQKNWVQPRIAVVAADAWPLPWYLRKYSQVGYWQPGQATGAADLYITSPEAAEKMSGQLTNFNAEYFGVRPEVLIMLWTPVPAKKPL